MISLSFPKINEPTRLNYFKGTLTQSGEISTTSGKIVRLFLNLSVPYVDSLQSASNPDVKIIQDAEGNMFAVLDTEKPPLPYRYSVISNIETHARTTSELPSSIDRSGMNGFLASDKQANYNERITKLATTITENATDDFEKIALLSNYVNKYITYDYSMAGKKKDAQWILDNRIGVCVEYTNLFTALARSIGYPVRYVSGYAYGSSLKWQGHSWAEAYLGKWIPVDPTWNSVGRIDAGHIVMYKSMNDQILSTVLAHTDNPYSRLVWNSDSTLGGVTDAITEIASYEDTALQFQLSKIPNEMSFGRQYVIVAAIDDNEYSVEELTLNSCVDMAGKPLLMAQKEKSFGTLYPDKTTYFYWIVTPDEKNYKSGAYYTCPVIISSLYHGMKKADIKIQGREAPGTPDVIFLKSIVNDINESNSAVVGSGSGTYHYLIGKNQLLAFKDRIEVMPESYGTNHFTVFTDNGLVRKLEFEVPKTKMIVAIPNRIEASDHPVEEEFETCIYVDNPENIEYNLLLMLNNELYKSTKTSSAAYCENISGLKPGSYMLEAMVNGKSVSKNISIYSPSDAKVTYSVTKIANQTKLDLQFHPEGEVNNIYVVYGNLKLPVHNNQAQLIVPNSGSFVNLMIVWEDDYQKYSKNMSINSSTEHSTAYVDDWVHDRNDVSIVMNESSGKAEGNGPIPCLGSLILAAVLARGSYASIKRIRT